MTSAARDFCGATLGNYRVVAAIGKGGMGMVYSGVHRFFDEPVAIKLLRSDVLDAEVSRRFFQEAKAARSIQHPNIVRILDFGEDRDAGVCYLVMELLEGQSLAAKLAANRGSVPEAVAARIGAAVADGLEAAHALGIVHRDLKPDNVFITRDHHVKVIDFGIAKQLRQTHHTAVGMRLGTPRYMAPEQLTDTRRIGPCTDIYLLGALLYRMVTGRPPFEGSGNELREAHLGATPRRPSETVALSSRFEALVLECLAKDPSQRPRSMRAVRDRLLAIAGEVGSIGAAADGEWSLIESELTRQTLATGPATAATVGLSGATPPTAARRGPAWVATAAAMLLIGSLGLFAAARWRSHTAARPSLPVPAQAASPPPAAPAGKLARAPSPVPSTVAAHATEAPPVEVRPAPRPKHRSPTGAAATKPAPDASAATAKPAPPSRTWKPRESLD